MFRHSGPIPTTTSIFTYSAFPGLTLSVTSTTPIPAVTATPVSVPARCQGGGSPGVGPSSGVSLAAPGPGASSASASSSSSGVSVLGASGATPTPISSGASSILGQPGGPSGGSGSNSASSGASPSFRPVNNYGFYWGISYVLSAGRLKCSIESYFGVRRTVSGFSTSWPTWWIRRLIIWSAWRIEPPF